MSLTDERSRFKPCIPDACKNLEKIVAKKGEPFAAKDEVKKLLSHIDNLNKISFVSGDKTNHEALRVGVCFSGGQASGGHNVISGLFDALKKLNPKSVLLGFMDGPIGVIEEDYIELTEDKIAPYRNQGGFDMIGSGRDKIETPEQFDKTAQTAKSLSLDGLVIIGGDDSNTNAALVAQYFIENKIGTKVIGVPKTIDGDLKNDEIEISFGFDTATKTYSDIIGSLARDAVSAKKYFFFVKLMGRSASHIALECALQTHPNLCLISEEVKAKKWGLQELTKEVARVISARQNVGKNYGVILIPEGIIEFLPDMHVLIKELNPLAGKNVEEVKGLLQSDALATFQALPETIQKQLLLDRDPHGNVQVSKIETERLLLESVKSCKLPKKIHAQPHFLGYEGRSCLPSTFDCNYCYALGMTAALLLDAGLSGYMACLKGLTKEASSWEPGGVPLAGMIHLEERKGKRVPVIRKALVELEGKPFKEFSAKRQSWVEDDAFCYPGPIQFFGPEEIVSRVTKTLTLERS